MNADTRTQIISKADFLIRTRGYAAFSYADLAEHLGVTKASIHYHFRSKEDLVAELVQESMARFEQILEGVKQDTPGAKARLRAYADLFLKGFEAGMLPLCGALAAERDALPEKVRPMIIDYFQIHRRWIREVVETGKAAGEIRLALPGEQFALVIVSVLEGGSFVGWAYEKKELVLAAFESALDLIEEI
jgi:TetR/AcrR family transcriptional repressor of nem operon